MNNLNLAAIKQGYLEKQKTLKNRIIVCAGTGCVANGSRKVYEAFKDELAAKGLDCVVDLSFQEEKKDAYLLSGSGCQGFCQLGPLVTIEPVGILYVKVTSADVAEIVGETICNHKLVERLLYKDTKSGNPCKGQEEITFYNRQQRTVLRQCGMIDPEDISEYISNEGYSAAEKAYLQMSPEEVCNEITASGLRGRGGGGFPTGRKWNLTRVQQSAKKYIICNGDEGDPGAFMDRSLMEGNPHAVIEGMMIAARGIGAEEGFVYVRAEYPLAVQRMKKAVKDATTLGILGKNVYGTQFHFSIEVLEGAGAFVCGEETAMIASIQGKRGMPSPKPPFPAERGLFDRPTVINNVETLGSVPLILLMGAQAYKNIGTASSPGTKTFALTGHVMNTGLIEVPFGTTLREIVLNIGGGVTGPNGRLDDRGFKAVQIGGPSGGCLTQEHLDLPLDFDSLKTIGAMVGSGGLVVMNHGTCMVRMAKFFMEFTQSESCGKCVLCREGTKQLLALLDDVIEGRATEETIPLMRQLANAVQKGSLCGLGKTAPNPVLSMLTYFEEEFRQHVIEKRCPAKECKALWEPQIDPALCRGCGVCIRKCPVEAISGERKQLHYINESLCIKCGACVDACRLKAIA